ncbi:AMP-dependent synthetase [Pedobacter lusitanus]|uniref:AMP-dependent synthetase n=1 Tax=Pedobacter lusitanus TaxID=1503925 RepID=A0A0D0G0V2_9SPHI|nr:AMP-binding protein [Pedobacter lusitanus]KIO78394.1 AMP-dependent synthetase [Pedobacter lusitanus]
MKLYDLIQSNKNLVFTDALTDLSYSVSEFHQSISIDDKKAVVFLYTDNMIGSVEVFLNFLQSRFTVTLLSPQLDIQFKLELEQAYQPYYIYDPSRTEIDGFSAYTASSRIQLFKNESEPDYPVHEEIKLLLSTSGTTGSPKFVKLSDQNLVQNAHSILEFLPILETDVTPLNVPIIFVYGLSIFTSNCIAGGRMICTNRDILQKTFWEDFDKYACTSIGGVPYVYEMLNRIGFFKKVYPSLRYMTQTGGILNRTLVQVLAEHSTRQETQFFVMYGQTEAAGRMAYLPPADLFTKNTSIGIPIKNGSFEIDPDSSELIYLGPNIFGGYAKKPEDLNTFHHSERLQTGDVGRKDEDGYYYITGRIKRIVKLFGTRMNLDEVELILKNALGGETFVCMGIEDKSILVLHLNEELVADQVKSILKEKLNVHPSMVKVKFVESVPLTPNGKIDYSTAIQLMD